MMRHPRAYSDGHDWRHPDRENAGGEAARRVLALPPPAIGAPSDSLLLQRVSHVWWLAWLMPLLEASVVEAPPPRALLAADRRPADDLTPALADVLAHATLTAAPPRSRVPVLAGAAA
jgi:hypothetical protein